MFNNFTDEEGSYESCSVIQPASPGSGALLIGDFNSAVDTEIIKLHNIKTIITAALGMEHLQIPSNIVHITYPLLDANSENIKRFFDESTTTIRNSNWFLRVGLRNGSVLVHCAAGISRVCVLLFSRRRWSLLTLWRRGKLDSGKLLLLYGLIGMSGRILASSGSLNCMRRNSLMGLSRGST